MLFKQFNSLSDETNLHDDDVDKINNYFDINWPNVLKLDIQNVDLSFNNFYEAINALLDKHAPYQKVKK